MFDSVQVSTYNTDGMHPSCKTGFQSSNCWVLMNWAVAHHLLSKICVGIAVSAHLPTQAQKSNVLLPGTGGGSSCRIRIKVGGRNQLAFIAIPFMA